MLILGVCDIIRSLSRVLLRFVLFLVVMDIFIGMLCGCGILGDILFICVEFIRALSDVG